MFSPHFHRIATWLPLSLCAFTLAGSLMLLAAFQHAARVEDRNAFQAQALASAAFLDRSGLPRSDRMARHLAEILGVSVWFQEGDQRIGAPGPAVSDDFAADRTVQLLQDEFVIGVPLLGGEPGASLLFARPVGEVNVLKRINTWMVLGGFWTMALALGLALTRRVIAPLGQLAEAVPFLGGERSLPVLPVDRADEIGDLARRFQHGHAALEKERERRREAERLSVLGKMAAGLAHEVRNPLAAIRLHAELIQGADGNERSHSLKLIIGETSRLENLIAQWLQLARPTPLTLQRVTARTVIARAVDLLKPQADHASVCLTLVDTPELDSAFRADADRLHQALSNLLLNAIQSMPEGGEVQLRSEIDEHEVLLHVEDDGSGFSSVAMNRADEAFFSEREGGMGLGLTIASEICLKHGGKLGWRNHLDHSGARLTIRLPLEPNDSSR